ncbi:hypothetical protein [Puniceicoccus vermicola]|uniref:Uncharacterized protein n=1 Tax=Puniceicoccus vermicola TaxID=388746 RepID=A0A7X1E7F9_9BACT|nr:hypothetical protein [Puniceicoccus vermicola]MBC2603697.1 hypothetical protein [Puniceicoccus vermicola]
MNTIVIIIMSAVILVGLAVIGNMFGLSLIGISYHVLLPGSIAGIHIVSSIALFKESKRRKENGKALFANLDPFFWGLVGLIFGIIGILTFRFTNDPLNERPNQSVRDNA